MTKLNQIVAIVSGKKTEAKEHLTKLHRVSASADVYSGLHRSYQSLDDEGETFPDESKGVGLTTNSVFEDLQNILSPVLDVVLTQDTANCSAFGEIKIDEVVLGKVPVTYLMFLEKQIVDLEKFFSSLPTLDSSTKWTFDENQGVFASEPVKTYKSKKVLQHKVLYEATKEHPAQIEKWTEDVPVGEWTTTKYSGAISVVQKNKIMEKLKKLKDAVKFAREEANSTLVDDKKISKDIFSYLLG